VVGLRTYPTSEEGIYCWVCDTRLNDGEVVMACAHPDDDGRSEVISLMAWHIEHDAPKEASEPHKLIRLCLPIMNLPTDTTHVSYLAPIRSEGNKSVQ